MKLTIGHLYPDLLNLYGDRGNIQCFRKRLEWRGIEAEVIPFLSVSYTHLADQRYLRRFQRICDHKYNREQRQQEGEYILYQEQTG